MNDLDLPPRAPLPAETRDRIRATVVAGLDESPRPGRNRWYQPLAAAAGIVVLATAAVVVVTRTGGGPTGDNRPTTTRLDTFAAECITIVDRVRSEGAQDWTVAAAATDGDAGAVMIRSQDQASMCEGPLPHPNGDPTLEPALLGPFQVEPSDVPNLWLIPFTNVAMRPPSYPLIFGGMVSPQASGMTLTLRDGNTVEADVADGTALALLPWNGASVPEVWPEDMSNGVMRDLIVSVRVVNVDGAVIYEGPPV
jgi:hypothetical protein